MLQLLKLFSIVSSLKTNNNLIFVDCEPWNKWSSLDANLEIWQGGSKLNLFYFQIIATCRGSTAYAGRYCGKEIPASFKLLRCQKVELRFRTDSSIQTDGFFITYRISHGPPPPYDQIYEIEKSRFRPPNVYKAFFVHKARRNKSKNDALKSNNPAPEVALKPLCVIALYLITAL